RRNAALVGLISRGLRWHALQVSAKICAADLPASRFAWACAGAAAVTAAAMTNGTIRATLATMNPPSQSEPTLCFEFLAKRRFDLRAQPAANFTPNLLHLKPLPRPRDFVLILASGRGCRSRSGRGAICSY